MKRGAGTRRRSDSRGWCNRWVTGQTRRLAGSRHVGQSRLPDRTARHGQSRDRGIDQGAAAGAGRECHCRLREPGFAPRFRCARSASHGDRRHHVAHAQQFQQYDRPGVAGSGLYAGYTLSTTLNISSARIRGIELSYQQQYSFLPGIFKGPGSFVNYTYLQAEGDFGAVATATRRANPAPRSGNAGITFRYRGLDVRFSATGPRKRTRAPSHRSKCSMKSG